MPKSALQVLFGTKADLQLAIVARAVEVFEAEGLRVADAEVDGLPQVRRLMTVWIEYLETFEGGCLFVAAASELDGRPGPVRDAIAHAVGIGETSANAYAGISPAVRWEDCSQQLWPSSR